MRLMLVAIIGFVLTASPGAGAFAQDPTPYDAAPEVCNPRHDRVVSRSIALDEFYVALVSPIENWTWDGGVLLTLHHLLEGAPLDPDIGEGQEILADVRPLARCFPERAYTRDGVATLSELVVAVIFAHPEGSFTFSGFRVIGPDGEPVTADDLQPDASVGELTVRLYDGTTMTVDALMEAGRTFVEPTPTPFPPGVPTPNFTVIAPDENFGMSDSDIDLPQTGTDAGDGNAWAPYAAGVVAALLFFAVGLGLRLRGR